MAETITYLAAPRDRFLEEQAQHAIKRDLKAADAAAGILSLQNKTGRDLWVSRLTLRVTTKSTAAATVDAGVAATEVASDNLLDGLDVGTAAVNADNITDNGVNGKKQGQLWKKDEFLTISKATGATAGMVGQAIINVVPT